MVLGPSPPTGGFFHNHMTLGGLSSNGYKNIFWSLMLLKYYVKKGRYEKYKVKWNISHGEVKEAVKKKEIYINTAWKPKGIKIIQITAQKSQVKDKKKREKYKSLKHFGVSLAENEKLATNTFCKVFKRPSLKNCLRLQGNNLESHWLTTEVLTHWRWKKYKTHLVVYLRACVWNLSVSEGLCVEYK